MFFSMILIFDFVNVPRVEYIFAFHFITDLSGQEI
jgi:hypothetical protein